MAKIDEKTTVPLWWAVMSMIALVSWTGIGATWVKGVNDRLSRIEAKLGISRQSEVAAGPNLVEPANASGKDFDVKK